MSIFLAVDQSTSATKALLFNERGELLDKGMLPHRQIYPRPGWVEHDASEIYANTLRVTQNLLEKNTLQAQQLSGLSITNQRETFVIFEKGSGEPLYNAIVWQCRRGEALCAQMNSVGFGDQVQQLTGLKIDTYFPAAKLRWLLDEHPEICRKLTHGEALFGTIDTYLIYRLTQGKVYATDHTNASRTLLYDINQLSWSTELCQIFGLPNTPLPELRESCAQFGETDLEGFLSAPLPIQGVMGDSQAALFAQRCFTPGSAKITFGSGSSVLLNIGSQKTLSNSGIVTAVGWVLHGRPTFAFEGITNFTGATIVWLRDQLELIASLDETEALAQAVPDNGGVYLVPAFVGLSAPYWRPDARAAITGLTPYTTKKHVVRAALESIAYTITDVLGLMGQDAGIELKIIQPDGGAVKNHFLMQFVADSTQLTVRASRLPELSTLGAVFAGGLGAGIYSSLQDLADLPGDFTEYHPVMDKKTAQTLYAGWQHAVKQVLST